MIDKQILTSTPHTPGVYLMLGKKREVLYVGKAKDLYKRLSSYVHHKGPEHSKTTVMLAHVHQVDTLLTSSEKEALILEASLIKKHRPRYNVILRDDKSYPYIKVTINEHWPRVFMTRRKKRDNARYYGPYSSSSAMWTTLKHIASLFPLRKCKGSELKARKRPCLNYQMGKCLAPCAGKADHDQYLKMVKNITFFLEGRNKKLLASLKDDMNLASAALEFEKAAAIRDKILSLETTLEKQIIVSQKMVDRDVIGFARKGTSVAISLLQIRKGIIVGNRRFFLDDPFGQDPEILSQGLSQIYDRLKSPPTEILLPFSVADQSVAQEHLQDLTERKLHIYVPQRSEPKTLMEMALSNAHQLLEEHHKKSESWTKLAESMVKKLKLTRLPNHLECVDISNLSGQNSVGSLVCFINGEPEKKRYRHYKIKSVEGPDDYASMYEVIQRRFKDGSETEDMPDLLLIDGGKGQLGVVQRVLEEVGTLEYLNLAAIAKEKEQEGEKVFLLNRKNPLPLPHHDPVLLFLMKVRDEAHRFGVTFHRSLRKKRTLASTLNDIPGVGPEKRQRLLSSLGSIKRIKSSSIEELSGVPGIGPVLARQIHEFLHRDEPPASGSPES